MLRDGHYHGLTYTTGRIATQTRNTDDFRLNKGPDLSETKISQVTVQYLFIVAHVALNFRGLVALCGCCYDC